VEECANDEERDIVLKTIVGYERDLSTNPKLRPDPDIDTEVMMFSIPQRSLACRTAKSSTLKTSNLGNPHGQRLLRISSKRVLKAPGKDGCGAWGSRFVS